MSAPAQSHIRNRLLSLMSPDDFALLAPHLEGVKLTKGFAIAEPNKPIDKVYFPDSGVMSIVTVSKEGLEAEAGMFGREGVGPLNPLMGSDRTPNQVYVQLPDDAWGIGVPAALAAMEASSTLRNLILRYAHTLSADSDDAATLFRFDAATPFQDDAATLGGGLVGWIRRA